MHFANLPSETKHEANTVSWQYTITSITYADAKLAPDRAFVPGRPGARNFLGWKTTSSPEARNYIPQPGIFKKIGQIFFILWVLLRIITNICFKRVQTSSEFGFYNTKLSKFENDFRWKLFLEK